MIESDESGDGADEQIIPEHILATAQQVIDNALPEKSKDKYRSAYEKLLAWQTTQGTTSFSEPVLLAYFKELSEKLKPSSLWAIHSMLKTTIDNNKSIDITKYTQLHRFLKRQGVRYESKKSKVLTSDQVQQFLRDAPDTVYLAVKAALILGIYGACRGGELCVLTTKNVIDKDSVLHVTLPDTKNHLPRSFVIDGEYYDIMKKYMNLRPQKVSTDRFFIKYHLGKCTQQPIGKNKLSAMPAEIAKYLNLPEPKSYTGHTFRRTSATILADAGADMIAIKRHGGWKSDRVAEGYIDDSINNKRKRSNQLTEFINSKPSTATSSLAQSKITSPKKIKNNEQMNIDSLLAKHSVSTEGKENSDPPPKSTAIPEIHYHFHIASIESFNVGEKKD